MKYQICTQCVLDTTAEEITFDDNGVCNFCHQAQKELEGIKKLEPIWIKDGKEYDCIIGLSGGVDSSFALYLAVKKLGLRPLAFSVDNGWNDPKADENIMRLVEGMKVPFIRYTINLDVFKELQSAFIQAGQKNIEIPTDHVLMAATYELANRYGIKTILSGGNVTTESIMPPSWGYNARDLVHIKDIYKKYTGKKLKGLPVCSLLKWNYYRWIKRLKIFYILDYYLPGYVRSKAIEILEKEFGYKDYGDKHGENQFTVWFQNFYLFKKFGIDKRKAHYSSMINSGQMTREQALERLTEPLYYPKFGVENKVLRYKRRDYKEFKTDEKIYKFISNIVRLCKF